MKRIPVQIVADVACPWSWVGKRALDIASRNTKIPIEYRWCPFQVYPHLPTTGIGRMDFFQVEYGEEAALSVMGVNDGKLKEAGDEVGCAFVHIEGSKVSNSLRALRLLQLAKTKHSEDVATALMEVMWRRFHAEGLHLGDSSSLVDCAAEVGSPLCSGDDASREELQRFVESVQLMKAVVEQAQESAKIARLTPTFVFPEKLRVEGSQPVDVMEELLRKLAERFRIVRTS